MSGSDARWLPGIVSLRAYCSWSRPIPPVGSNYPCYFPPTRGRASQCFTLLDVNSDPLPGAVLSIITKLPEYSRICISHTGNLYFCIHVTVYYCTIQLSETRIILYNLFMVNGSWHLGFEKQFESN